MRSLWRIARIVRPLDLQAKVILILVMVVLPTFLVVTIVENQLFTPILKEEMRQIGITTGKTLSTQIVTRKLYLLANPTGPIESSLQELILTQPSIVRMDVLLKDPESGHPKLVASNFEGDPNSPPPSLTLVDSLVSELKTDDLGVENWDILVPVRLKRSDLNEEHKTLGTVRVVISMKLLSAITDRIWQITVIAASISVVLLIGALSYFLRKTIATDRKLKEAESKNILLTEQLHEAQRQVMNNEKLAVMGQLTASFAHEIGTPLGAIGGHLQLLKEETGDGSSDRIGVIEGQLSRIEGIVKEFLQSTAKPKTQRQLVDLNQLIEKTLNVMRPRIDSLGIETKSRLDREMGPIRVVPEEAEQVLINLINNSLDSLNSKRRIKERGRFILEIESRLANKSDGAWAEITVFDTGTGIRKSDLSKVLKPFFTTKAPGEGTGLGLTISLQLARKYGGVLEIDSKEGAWTRVGFRLPYSGGPL